MGITASELVEMKAQRYTSDPAYRAVVDAAAAQRAQIKEAREQKLSTFKAALRAAGSGSAERRSDGWAVMSPVVAAVVFDQLSMSGYDDETRAAIARHLQAKGPGPSWSAIQKLYLEAQGPLERDALAGALSLRATRADVPALINLASNETLDSSRVHFLRPINRLNRTSGRAFVSALTGHALLGKEASAIVSRRGASA